PHAKGGPVMARFLWTQRQDVGPSPRFGHAMAYDTSRHRSVLFGGDAGAGALLGDTWAWDGEYWTQVADTGPSARRDAGLAFDGARVNSVLFGGSGGVNTVLGDTWVWNGEDWTQ